MDDASHLSAGERAPLLPTTQTSDRSNARSTSSRRWRICGLTLTALVVILTGIGLYLQWLLRYVPEDFPPDGPGIGIALSTHYGTIAIRNDNGKVVNLARVDASDAYVQTIQRLSLPASKHPSPPYFSLEESWGDRPRQYMRRLRKKLGYPASADVGILADLLKDLVSAAEDRLSPSQKPLTSAVVTIPTAMALYSEDVQDALEYLGLQAISSHSVYGAPRALPAAYVASGFGLCAQPDDLDACMEEEAQMPQRGVLAIEMNQKSFSADSRMMSTPLYSFNEDRATLEWQVELGKPEDETNWAQVRAAIEKAIHALEPTRDSRPSKKVLDEIFLMGDEAVNAKMLTILRELVIAVQNEDVRVWADEPVFAAARGAAEMAKRLLLQHGKNRFPIRT